MTPPENSYLQMSSNKRIIDVPDGLVGAQRFLDFPPFLMDETIGSLQVRTTGSAGVSIADGNNTYMFITRLA